MRSRRDEIYRIPFSNARAPQKRENVATDTRREEFYSCAIVTSSGDSLASENGACKSMQREINYQEHEEASAYLALVRVQERIFSFSKYLRIWDSECIVDASNGIRPRNANNNKFSVFVSEREESEQGDPAQSMSFRFNALPPYRLAS